jgi:hypothetical protein
MNKFKIEVISKKPKKIDGLLSHMGQITIGDYKETFVMPLNSWTLEEYQQQWKEGLERIKNRNTSCLVTTVQNFDSHPLIEMWSLYKEGDKVFFHVQLINRTIAKELNLPIKLSEFSVKTCYQFINPRLTNEEGEGIGYDGEKISEWSIDLS